MPRRTNVFQQLIFLIKQQIATDAAVRESAFLVDRQTGEEREVDVVIESTVAGGHPLIVGIECVDHSRRAGLPWVDSMSRKHARLPTDLLILASRRGFTKGAVRQARADGIQLITPESSQAELEELSAKRSNFALFKLQLFGERVTATIAGSDVAGPFELEVLPHYSAFLENRYELGPFDDLVRIALGQAMEQGLIAQASESRKTFVAEVNPLVFYLNADPHERWLYVELNNPEPHLARVESMVIRGSVNFSTTDVPAEFCRVPGVEFHYGEHVTEHGSALIVRTVQDDGTEQVSIRNADGTVDALSPLEED